MRKAHPLLWACFIVLGLTCGCSEPPQPATNETDTIQLAIVSGLHGTTAPCGCTSKPLGGIDRLLHQIDLLSAQAPTAWLVVGDTRIGPEPSPTHLQEQTAARAELIDTLLAGRKPLAYAPGPHDSALAGMKLKPFNKPKDRLSASNVHRATDSVIENIGPITVGVLGIPGDAPQDPARLSAQARALRAQGATLIVALLPLPEGHRNQVPLDALQGIDVALLGGNEGEPRAFTRGKTLIVAAGDQGRYLGVLDVKHSGQSQPVWHFFDEGRPAREALASRITRLREQLLRLPAGAAREARHKKLEALEKDLQNWSAPKPPDDKAIIRWHAIPIAAELEGAPDAARALKNFDSSLCDIAKRADLERQCPQAAANARYVGTPVCAACHQEAQAFYQTTAHAHAWATLEEKGKTCDLGCIGCHTVGFEQPGGFCRLGDAESFANVGCENCHGPGAGHVSNPSDPSVWGSHFVRAPSASKCVDCHNAEHSDLFDFATYLPRILGPGHGAPTSPTQ